LPVSVVTLAGMPRNENGTGAEVVTVTGGQWYWNLDREQVPAGVPVEFRVTSVDVNHGIGLYDPELRLLGQTQAMPGYVNHLRHTFHQPGTYRLLCLEYCGLAHHGMVAELTVVAR
jgi:cytochrome c oxidase subunit 2